MRGFCRVFAAGITLAALVPGRVTAAVDAASAVSITRTELDVFSEKSGEKVGRMRIRVTRVAGVVVLKADFAADFKGDEAGYRSTLHYRTGQKPRLVRAEVSTRIDEVKLMEGRVALGDAGETGAAELTISGFADRKKRLFAEPKRIEKEVTPPEGAVLAYPSFLYFAPRMLSKTGRLEGLVYADLPDDLGFPELVQFFGDCVLVRTGRTDPAGFRIELRQKFAGGNYKTKAAAVYDTSGRVTEASFAGFVMRPAKKDAPFAEEGPP